MNRDAKPLAAALAGAALLALAMPAAAANPCNPCAPKAKNPCAAKAKNPCAASDRIDPKLITRPKGTRLYAGNPAELRKEGEKLWNDTKLSTNGMSCNSCHQSHGAFEASFAKPYPHKVQMASDRAGLKTIHLDEMIQACMVMPMAAKPLAWDSRELAALTAYTAEVQKTFKPAKAGQTANPCAAKNPCASKNPCAGKK